MPTFLREYAKKAGLKIVDAKHNKVFTLTPADVKKSLANDGQKDSTNCGFAVALKREMPGCEKAVFFRTTAWVESAQYLTRYLLPPSMQKEIVSFDRAGIMEPGVYSMRAPTKGNTLKDAKKRQKRRQRGATGGPRERKTERRIAHTTANIRNLNDPAWGYK